METKKLLLTIKVAEVAEEVGFFKVCKTTYEVVKAVEAFDKATNYSSCRDRYFYDELFDRANDIKNGQLLMVEGFGYKIQSYEE